MNIAIAIHHFDAGKGGAERFAADLARSMIEQGHQVHVYASTCKEEDDSISFHPVKAVRRPRFLYELTFAVNSSRALRRDQHHVVIGINRTFHQDVYALPSAAHSWRRQNLRSFRNPLQRYARLISKSISPKQRLAFYIENRIYGDDHVRKVVANSHMVKEDIIKHYRVPPSKVEVIYHGVDLEKFHPRNRTKFRHEIRASLGINEGKVILFVGHDFRLKGLHSFILVISLLKKRGLSGFRGLVVGRGKSRPFLREAEKLGCSELLVFPGPRGDMRRVYAAADLLLQPTYYDSCSLTTLEALASGLPVVTTRYNGAGELITEGQEGYVVDDPGDIEKLAHRVSQLLDEERLATCSVKARGLAERFPLHQNHIGIMELCKEVAAAKREE